MTTTAFRRRAPFGMVLAAAGLTSACTAPPAASHRYIMPRKPSTLNDVTLYDVRSSSLAPTHVTAPA